MLQYNCLYFNEIYAFKKARNMHKFRAGQFKCTLIYLFIARPGKNLFPGPGAGSRLIFNVYVIIT